MKIKICGLTNLNDALAAAEAGADLLGFNFYSGSPRYIDPAHCAEITAALRAKRAGVLTVGVFVNAPVSTITEVQQGCHLDLAQLHGDEPPGKLEQLEGRAFKAIRPQTPAEADGAWRRYSRVRHGQGPELLVDAHRAGQYGGTGEVGDWGLAKSLAAKGLILLAGGLTPENVSAAIAQVGPWGVDVASGVESWPGIKDLDKLRAFVQAVRISERETMQ